MGSDEIYARLQVVDPVVDKAVVPVLDNHLPWCKNAPYRITGRLNVLDDSIARGAFDTVRLCLRGIIATTVGQKTSLEDIITLTDVKSANEFTESPQYQNGRHLDFYFELPTAASTANGVFRPLPISGKHKGSMIISQNSAMNDLRTVYGECEVSYWIEAKFRRAGKQVGLLYRHVQVQSLYPRLQAIVSGAKQLTVRAKPDILARYRFQKAPDLSVMFPDAEMVIGYEQDKGKRCINIPLAIEVKTSDDVLPSSLRQALPCTVEARWQVNTRMSTTRDRKTVSRPKAPQTILRTSTASTQKSTILFSPLPDYENTSSSNPQSTLSTSCVLTTQLELAVPDSLSQPTLDWAHLSRGYALVLTMQFRGTHGIPNYSLTTSLPLSVVAYGTKADDVLFGNTPQYCLEADYDSNEEGDLVRMLGSTELVRGDQTPTRLPTSSTPPPPYFR